MKKSTLHDPIITGTESGNAVTLSPNSGGANLRQNAAIVVRKAVAADTAHLMPLIQAHASFELSHATASTTSLEQALDGRFPALHAWLAFAGARPIGYAAATIDFATWRGRQFLHLDCLFIEGGWRGHGVGKQLLMAVFEFARAKSIECAEWQTPSWNEEAIRFYKSLGAIARDKARFTLQLD